MYYVVRVSSGVSITVVLYFPIAVIYLFFGFSRGVHYSPHRYYNLK